MARTTQRTIDTAKIMRSVKERPDSHLVFIGKDCAIHDGEIAHAVSRTVALAAIQFGRMTKHDIASNGITYFT